MKNAQDLSFKPPNFIESNDLLAIVEFVKLDSIAGHAYFLSYLFGLRVPSETLRLTRSYRDGRITEFAHQTDKALIATRNYKEAAVLVIKFAFREILETDASPCDRVYASQYPGRLMTSARSTCFGASNRQGGRVKAGAPLFPGIKPNAFNRQLKAAMAALGFGRGGMYSPHAFRRGATDEIKNSG